MSRIAYNIFSVTWQDTSAAISTILLRRVLSEQGITFCNVVIKHYTYNFYPWNHYCVEKRCVCVCVEKPLTKMPALSQCSLASCSTSPQNFQLSGHWFDCHTQYLLPAASNSTLKSTETRYCKWFWKGLWLHSSVPSSAKLSPNSDSQWRSNWQTTTNNQDILGYSVPMVWHVVWKLWTCYSIWPSVTIKQQRTVCIYILTLKLYSCIHFIYVFFTFQHI